jgi:threonine aldolase
MLIHDFRSDTVTLPTPEMMAAIATARLGDSGRGDDPTVNELERLGRELTGKDDALFVPSGTMANLSALIAHGCRGGEVIVEEDAHIYNSEGGGLSVVAGAVARPVPGNHGLMSPDDVRAVIRSPADLALAPAKLICLEQTHNHSGGCVLPLNYLAAMRALAQEYDLPIHLDGARLFNAATYLNVPILEICQHADSVWFALCKGLGGPVGAILAGDKAFMQRARRAAKMLGGGMRQAGLIAAPAIVGLKHGFEVHERDHALAQRLAHGLAAIDASLVELGYVHTNIVNCYVDRYSKDAGSITRALDERGVLANSKRSKIRFVTHYHLNEASVDAALAAVADVLRNHSTHR